MNSHPGKLTSIQIIILLAILAVLAAIIIPFLDKGMNAAHEQKCADNLRKCYAAVRAFSAEYQNRIPRDQFNPSPMAPKEMVPYDTKVTGKFRYVIFRYAYNTNKLGDWNALKRADSIFYCPADTEPLLQKPEKPDLGVLSYGFNHNVIIKPKASDAVNPQALDRRWITWDDPKLKGSNMMMYEMSHGKDRIIIAGSRIPVKFGYKWANFSHGGKTHFLHMDGSISLRAPKEIPLDPTLPEFEDFWGYDGDLRVYNEAK